MLTRWSPLTEVERTMDRMLRELLREWPTWRREGPADLVSVPVEIYETEEDFVVRALVPGLKAEDLEITVENGILTLSGELKEETVEGANYLVREIPSGRFVRSFTLPRQVDQAGIKAHLENGVLTIHLPKQAEAKPKKIKVQVK